MILIPGLQCSGAVWNEAVVFYSDKYQVHVLTIAGFAGEPAIPGLPLSTVRDDLLRYIRENKLIIPLSWATVSAGSWRFGLRLLAGT